VTVASTLSIHQKYAFNPPSVPHVYSLIPRFVRRVQSLIAFHTIRLMRSPNRIGPAYQATAYGFYIYMAFRMRKRSISHVSGPCHRWRDRQHPRRARVIRINTGRHCRREAPAIPKIAGRRRPAAGTLYHAAALDAEILGCRLRTG
jgi:hypothetical protein